MKIIVNKIRRNFILLLIILSHLVFSYNLFNGWWYSGIGTVLIMALSYFLWRDKFLEQIGLKINTKIVVMSMILAGVIIIFSFRLSAFIANAHGIQIQLTYYGNYLHDIFYTLNEEIILGALLLFYFIRKFKVHPLLISALVALIFSLIHYIFYKWIFLDRGIIQPSTLSTLLFIGFMRNNLILRFRHIGYSWAFHFSWMAVMFGSHHYFIQSGARLTEPQRFNFYLGSDIMFVIAIALSAISVWLFYYKPGKKHQL